MMVRFRPHARAREFHAREFRPRELRALCSSSSSPSPSSSSSTSSSQSTACGGAISRSGSSSSASSSMCFESYLDVLEEWNARIALTAPMTRSEMKSRHIDDSLALLPSLDSAMASMTSTRNNDNDNGGETNFGLVIDVGSGTGMPGLAIAAERPTWRVTLLESIGKKCAFMEAAAEAMGLDNVRVVCARAEDAAAPPKPEPKLSKRKAKAIAREQDKQAQDGSDGAESNETAQGHPNAHREAYDVCVARAVAAMPTLAEITLPFVRVGGALVAAKGPRASAEQEVSVASRAIAELGGDVDGVRILDVASYTGNAGADGTREQLTCVVVNKISSSNSKYPRRAGMPNKRPIV
ncbi:16S rRNA (guanine527-N7)-methyltransferase [Pseudoscourfieldia marina]